MPDLVVGLTTPPLNRPNSAGGLLLSILNSLNRVDVRKKRDLPWLGLQHRNAVEQILVYARSTAVDTQRDEFGGRATPGTKPRGDEAATIQRQRENLVIIDDLPRLAEFSRSSDASPATLTASVRAQASKAASTRTVWWTLGSRGARAY